MIQDTTEFRFQNTAVALGKFDGIHRGHKKILREINRAKEDGLTTVVFTFSVQPSCILQGKKEKLLLTGEEKIQLYEDAGVDVLIIYPVSSAFFQMEPEEFVKNILIDRLGMKLMIGGTDLKFGKDKKGDAALAGVLGETYGFQLRLIEKESRDSEIISSTSIRRHIEEGKMEEAAEELGYPYFISGEILHGKELGRKMGIPTINQGIDGGKLLPPYGVYLSETVIRGETYASVTNIGCKPTVKEDSSLSAETHILDFDRQVYGEQATVRLLRFLRPEMKFANVEELRKRLLEDIHSAEKLSAGCCGYGGNNERKSI